MGFGRWLGVFLRVGGLFFGVWSLAFVVLKGHSWFCIAGVFL